MYAPSSPVKWCWPGLEELVLNSNTLKVQQVYSVALDIVDQHVACKFAGLLTASFWFEECKLHRADTNKLANVSLDIRLKPAAAYSRAHRS